MGSLLGGYAGLFDRRVWLLTWGQTLLSLGRGVLMPFATLYFYHVRGFPLTVIGLGFAIALPLGALAGLFWGAVADRAGRKPLMLLGFGGQAVSTVALAFVATPAEYVAAVVANSLAVSAWSPSARAMVADVTPAERRTRAYGLLYMANNLGMSLGLLLGGVLAVFLPYRALFFAEAAGALAFMLVVLAFVAESYAPVARGSAPADSGLRRVGQHLRDLGTPLRDRTFLMFLGVTTLAGIGWSQFYITYTPFMKDYLGSSDTWIAIVIALNTVLVVVLQVPLAAWAERRRKTTVFFLANYALAWSLMMTWAAGRVDAGGMALLLAGVFVMTLGEIAVAPVGPALAAALAGKGENFGKYMAANDLTWALSSGAGSVIGGVFFDVGYPMMLWPVATAVVIVSLVGFLLLSRKLPDALNRPAPRAPGASATVDDVAPAS